MGFIAKQAKLHEKQTPAVNLKKTTNVKMNTRNKLLINAATPQQRKILKKESLSKINAVALKQPFESIIAQQEKQSSRNLNRHSRLLSSLKD